MSGYLPKQHSIWAPVGSQLGPTEAHLGMRLDYFEIHAKVKPWGQIHSDRDGSRNSQKALLNRTFGGPLYRAENVTLKIRVEISKIWLK